MFVLPIFQAAGCCLRSGVHADHEAIHDGRDPCPTSNTRFPSTALQETNNLDPVPSVIPLGSGNLVPATPASHFDWADFINVTPNSLAQNDGKTM